MTDVLEFIGMEPAGAPDRWRLPVTRAVCGGATGALFGGVALAAGVEAMERFTGRPLVWATVQYLSFARPPAVIELEVVEASRGYKVSQARAVGRAGETEVFTVNAALGTREFEGTGVWAEPPAVPPPEACPPRPLDERFAGSLVDRIEMRLADARDPTQFDDTPGSGRSALWARVPGLGVSSASLAVVGDMVPFGISQALGMRAGGNSLDNTLRMVQLVATEWMLLDVRIYAVVNGYGHGHVHIWSEDRQLLATGSQSAIVRTWRDSPPR